ncbi:hypothetical protein L1F30_04245 [Simiduia sp. 21SJ11W-1]|uniref:hypothetical protein n=1 Tax=Simiduia sp. 21SJ11W-1 TaxID=2909669 RepID=UPI00209EF609|nr:hypothetical protein [Simiduia sp. 21SJ11W-1]UTA48759.1 hypothetical protein L1F30_04245 [Simiduia sp. 21SJ11W-1]
MCISDSKFTRVELSNRLGQLVAIELLCHRDASTDLVIVRLEDDVAGRRLAKNIEHFAKQLLGLCESDPARLQIVEWREQESGANLWRWRFNWVADCPLDAKLVPVKAGHHKHINGLLSSLTAAAA